MVRYQPYRPSAPALPARAHPLAMTEVLEYPLVVPTREDFEALGVTKDLAFAEKRGCWSTAENNQKALQKAYESYLQQCPRKLDHCRIIKGTDENGKVIVYAACQLQMPGDPGDLMFSDPSWRHKLLPGEAYVEFIATHPDYTGKGLGSKLLAWAFEFCENYRDEDGNAVVTWLSLEGAIRLYERKGLWSRRIIRMKIYVMFCLLRFVSISVWVVDTVPLRTWKNRLRLPLPRLSKQWSVSE